MAIARKDISDSKEVLQDVVRRIRRLARPQKIVLFGSRARGDARRSSDFDLLIVKPSRRPRYRRSARIYAALADVPAEIEVVVYTPEEIRQWRQVPQAFVTTALREGKVLYDSEQGPS